MSVVKGLKERRAAALARAITLVENEAESASEILEEIHGLVGRAYRIGVTGPPGAGKSTLVGALTELLVGGRGEVGIIAVDPSSPFTGG
ncbi:MAG: methylmalonyl Co-A mutase-associated GTPase MeaB, partial [Planctomycetota bacterium]